MSTNLTASTASVRNKWFFFMRDKKNWSSLLHVSWKTYKTLNTFAPNYKWLHRTKCRTINNKWIFVFGFPAVRIAWTHFSNISMIGSHIAVALNGDFCWRRFFRRSCVKSTHMTRHMTDNVEEKWTNNATRKMAFVFELGRCDALETFTFWAVSCQQKAHSFSLATFSQNMRIIWWMDIFFASCIFCGFVGIRLIQNATETLTARNEFYGWKKQIGHFIHSPCFCTKKIKQTYETEYKAFSLKMLKKRCHSLNIDWPFVWVVRTQKLFRVVFKYKIFMLDFDSILREFMYEFQLRADWWIIYQNWTKRAAICARVREKETKRMKSGK